MKHLKVNILFVFLVFTYLTKAQQLTAIDTSRIATYTIATEGMAVTFTPVMPPQEQVAGAPPAFYSYFWEFGDGNFSKDPNPTHVYAAVGEYTPHLSVKAAYDNGSLPPIKPKPKPKVTQTAYHQSPTYTEGLNIADTMAIFCDKDPIPNEEIVVVVRYSNPLPSVSKGKLYLFYNDKAFKKNNFEIKEIRSHFGEQEVTDTRVADCMKAPSDHSLLASDVMTTTNDNKIYDVEKTIADLNMHYRDYKLFDLPELDTYKTNNIFFSFKTTSDMIKDTSAIVTMEAVYIPDEYQGVFVTKTLEMEIVTSHDPNKMGNNGVLMNYRLVRFKRVKFKTRFQNDGEGPAKTIRLETDVPDMFDKSTLQIEDMYPKCAICPKDKEVRYSCLDTIILANQIHFTFKNIHLPGTHQKNVKEKDSTKGFVSYSLKFGKDFHKVKTKSRTAIFFDKNEPVITNYTTTRFSPGISLGARAGYNYILPKTQEDFSTLENKSFFLGATISPFKSYRWYWQSELGFNYTESNGAFTGEMIPPDFQGENFFFRRNDSETTISQHIIDVVPVSVRYNINNYIGLGTGPQVTTLLANKEMRNEISYFFMAIQGEGEPPFTPGEELTDLRRERSFESRGFEGLDRFQIQWFADVTFGFARIGPSVGVRYLHNFNTAVNTLQFYAIWKF